MEGDVESKFLIPKILHVNINYNIITNITVYVRENIKKIYIYAFPFYDDKELKGLVDDWERVCLQKLFYVKILD